MKFDSIEELYIHGEYQKILDFPNDSLDQIQSAILNSYKSRSLIRLGKIHESETLVSGFEVRKLNTDSSIADLINETSLFNLLNTLGRSKTVIERSETNNIIDDLQVKNGSLSGFWACFYFYLVGMAYYYELDYEKSTNCYLKSLEINKNNQYIKGKSYYYLGYIALEQDDQKNFIKYTDQSLEILKSLHANQAISWIYIWRGNQLIQKGDYIQAEDYLNQAFDLVNSVGGAQETNFIKSLLGLISYNNGELEKAKELLNESFSVSAKLGNPMLTSYILLPFIVVNLESGNSNRKFIEDNLKIFEQFNKDRRVLSLLKLAQAIFLKSSPKFVDKAKAQSIFIELLEKLETESNFVSSSGDKTTRFLLTINLAEIYYLEFLTSKDLSTLADIQELIDNFRNKSKNEIIHETILISILKSKILIVEGKIEEALNELNSALLIATENEYTKLIEDINKEIRLVHSEIGKWGIQSNILDRIKAVDMELYIKEAQKVAGFETH